MIATLLPLLLESVLPQAPHRSLQAPDQAVARAVQVLSTGGLLKPLPIVPVPRFGVQNGSTDRENPIDLLGGHADDAPYLSPEDLNETLKKGLGSAGSVSDLDLEFVGGRLLLSGTPDLVDLAKKRLQTLLDEVARPIRVSVELHALPAGSAPIPSVLTKAQIAEFTQGGRTLWQAAGSARSGTRAHLATTRSVRYVSSIGVEVAQKCKTTDPLLTQLEVGTSVSAEVHMLAGSNDLVIYAQYKHAELVGEIAQLGLGTVEHPMIDTPVLSQSCGGFSGRIPDGGALALTLRGEGEFQRLLVLRADTGNPNRDLAKLGFFPATALRSRALDCSFRKLLEFPDGEKSDVPQEEAGAAIGEDVLQNLVTAAFEGNSLPTDVLVGPRFFFVPSESDARRRITTVLRTLEDQVLRTAQLELGLSQVADGDGDGGRARSANSLPRGLRAPVLFGRTHPWILGVETRAVADFEVEIAQSAAILAPVVVTLFRGVTLSGQVVEGTTGAPGLDATLCVQTNAEPRRRSLSGPAGGELQRTDVERAVFFVDAPGPLGAPIECGDGVRADPANRTGLARPTLAVTDLSRPTAR